MLDRLFYSFFKGICTGIITSLSLPVISLTVNKGQELVKRIGNKSSSENGVQER